MKTLKDRKDYKEFLNENPKYKEDLRKILQKLTLSYDEEEVRKISGYFVDLNEKGLFDLTHRKMFAMYLGETFMKKYGGEWFYGKFEKDESAFNEPVITKFKNEGIRFCPAEHITSILESKNSNEFNETIVYMDEMRAKTEAVFAELFPKKKRKK